MKISLYHYTNVDAVYSILRTKKIWLTDVRFLNDTSELHDGVEKLSEVLKRPQHGLFSNDDFKNESTEFLRSSFKDKNSYGINEEPVFVFSFSQKENVLSQWRAYGRYAIEFDRRILHKHVSDLTHCCYDQKTKKNFAKNFVTTALADISQDMSTNNGIARVKSIDALGKLIKLAATFKHEGFSEEDEMRIVAQASVDDDFVKYRPMDNRLIPFIEMDVSLDSIKAIHVGPMSDQELAYISMAAFVQKIESKWQIESNNYAYKLSVEKSSIPYRGE
ncbi:MAG: DUF2971 domain-containing protein [Desulfobacteraceae bacterium]|nr:DUF2971 domain-containing protein [Desulfobacteraceae bacterium]